MHKKYWHQKWQSNEIGFNQQQPNELMCQYFDSLSLKQGSRVFVPLCGKSIDMVWLASQGYDVVGVELSRLEKITYAFIIAAYRYLADFFMRKKLTVQ